MPVNEGTEGSVAAAAAADTSADPIRVPVTLPPGYSGPVLPPSTGGFRGLNRFQAEQNMMANLKPGTPEYRTWILSLKEDPNDPEYSRLLRAAQFEANRAVITPAPGTASAPEVKPAAPAKETPATLPKDTVGAADRRGRQEFSGDGPDPLVESTGREENRLEYDRQKAAAWAAAPVFRGRPVGTDELYQPDGPYDPFLDGFLNENGVRLDGSSRNKAFKSGQYVYMGQEYNEKLGVSRDVYVYKDDAQAASQNLDPALISGYQKELGLEVTGRMDPYLQPIWEEAVKFAQDSARSGHKTSVKEWFDLFVRSAIAKKKAAGASGAAAAGPEEFDYYRGMMQVLGDISGVGGG